LSSERRPEAMDGLYREHFPSLIKVAYLLTGSAAAAEDAVHDVFVRIIDRADSIDHPSSYLRAAVVNECRTQHRRRQRRQTLSGKTEEELPHDLVETRDALTSLTPRRRAAVVLRYFADVHDDEIALILNCRPATVRSLIHRALNDLRETLQ
jgi:RNA polymerase sigma factor (sigma-70 family)